MRATAWGISLRSFREMGEIICYVVDELLIVWLSVKLSRIMGKDWKDTFGINLEATGY